MFVILKPKIVDFKKLPSGKFVSLATGTGMAAKEKWEETRRMVTLNF
jgi:hypothetical protein